jgi:hypothetical protein
MLEERDALESSAGAAPMEDSEGHCARDFAGDARLRARDPVSKQPELKSCAASVTPESRLADCASPAGTRAELTAAGRQPELVAEDFDETE